MNFFKERKDEVDEKENELLPNDVNNEETEEQIVNTIDSDTLGEGSSIINDWLEGISAAEAHGQDDNQEILTNQTYLNEENITEDEEKEEGFDMGENENVDLELLDALNAKNTEDEVEVKPQGKKVASLEEDVTIISKGSTINGSVSSEGSLDIIGTVVGDVECLGKLTITGKVKGNSTAGEIYVNTDRIEGTLNSEGSVKVALGTVVVGDIVATSGVIAGAVKGEIDINGPIIIDSTAIIKGNIKAKSVQVNNGAVIEGFCSLCYASVDVENIFE